MLTILGVRIRSFSLEELQKIAEYKQACMKAKCYKGTWKYQYRYQ